VVVGNKVLLKEVAQYGATDCTSPILMERILGLRAVRKLDVEGSDNIINDIFIR